MRIKAGGLQVETNGHLLASFPFPVLGEKARAEAADYAKLLARRADCPQGLLHQTARGRALVPCTTVCHMKCFRMSANFSIIVFHGEGLGQD